MTSANIDFRAGFFVRTPYPYWTDRRLVNGVISGASSLIGDADLELIIEGVMDDLKVWADAENIDYTAWTNIDLVPLAIKRAATYATVSSLYSRKTNTFQTRVIPTVSPVSITVMGEDQKAMIHWDDKTKEMLNLYISAQGRDRLLVSTIDEEPVFSMDDITGSSSSSTTAVSTEA
jgi:hypothetical protein